MLGEDIPDPRKEVLKSSEDGFKRMRKKSELDFLTWQKICSRTYEFGVDGPLQTGRICNLQHGSVLGSSSFHTKDISWVVAYVPRCKRLPFNPG